MRKATFQPPLADPGWLRWQARAERQRTRITKAFERFRAAGFENAFFPKLEESLFRDARPFVSPAFYKKCAYCESPDASHTEHFRPKSAVVPFRFDSKHPLHEHLKAFVDLGRSQNGYFWLAFQPDNLLPACASCNAAKACYFPAGGARRLRYDEQPDESIEATMLLHPLYDEPPEHLSFADPSGYVAPLSLRGALSIAVYRLNRESLPDLRRLEMERASELWGKYAVAVGKGRRTEAAEFAADLRSVGEGRTYFSAAALTAIGIAQERLTTDPGSLRSPIRAIWPSQQRRAQGS